MKLKNSKWVMAMLGAIAFLVVATIVWASPPASPPSVPPQASPGFDADMVDGHHAAYSGAKSNTKRANRLLWATSTGKLHRRAMPKSWLLSTRSESLY